MMTPHPPVPDSHPGGPAAAFLSSQPVQPWIPPQVIQRLGDPSPLTPNSAPLPSPQGIAPSTVAPVHVTEYPREPNAQSGTVGQQSPLRMLQSAGPEQSSIYCQEAPLLYGPPAGHWMQHKTDAMEFEQVAQLDCLNKVVSLNHGAVNKMMAGEARRSPPTSWKPPGEMKTGNAGFGGAAGNSYPELLDHGLAAEDSRNTMSREHRELGALDNCVAYDTSMQAKASFFGNGDGTGQVQALGPSVAGHERSVQAGGGYVVPNGADRPLHGLMPPLTSSSQPLPESMHDNNYFPRMLENGSFQRDKALWAAAMSFSNFPEATPDHNAFLNNLATQIERNQQLSNGRLPNPHKSFPPADVVQDRNPSAPLAPSRAPVGRTHVNPTPLAAQFVNSGAPKESFSSQLNRLVGLPGYSTNFNGPVYANYETQGPRHVQAPARPPVCTYNSHVSYNDMQEDWDRLQSVGSFPNSRHRNTILAPQDAQQFGVNGVPALKYKQSSEHLNWSRVQDMELASDQYLDMVNQQSGNMELPRDYGGSRNRALGVDSDYIAHASGRALVDRHVSRDDGMAQRQQYWMGPERNTWIPRSTDELGASRSNSVGFDHHVGNMGIGGKMDLMRHSNQPPTAQDDDVRDRASLVGTGRRLFNENFQNQSVPLIQHGRDNALNSYNPAETTSFPTSTNYSDMPSVKGHSDGRVGAERSLVASDQVRGSTGNSENQILKARVNPQRSDTHNSLQEGDPAPPTPEKCDIVDAIELKCPHGDFGSSKQEMHDATSIIPMSDITHATMAQPSTVIYGDFGKPVNGLCSEQGEVAGLGSENIHLKPSPQDGDRAIVKSGRPHARADEDVDAGDSASLLNKKRKVGENGDATEGGFSAEVAPKAGYPLALDMLVDAVQVASGSMQDKDVAEPDGVAHTSSLCPEKEVYSLHEGVHVVRRKVIRRAKSIFRRQASMGSDSNGSTNGDGTGELSTLNCQGNMLSTCREGDQDAENLTDDGRTAVSSPGSKETDTAPLVRSKRGRAQMLPSRLRDSVLEPLKKGPVKGFKRDTSEDPDSGSALHDNPQKRMKEGSEGRAAPGSHHVKEEYGTPAGREDSAQGVCQDWSPKAPKESEGTNRGPAGQKHISPPLSDIEVTWDSAGRSSTGAVSTTGLHPLEEFDVGDVVWAKSGKKNDPVWPAKVVDPIKEVPDTVRSVCVPGRLCVMFFGKSLAKKKERDYAWVRQGMIFPFLDYLERFQGQTNFTRYRPMDFVVAINEATLADAGFDDCQGMSGKCHPSVSHGDFEKPADEGQDTDEIVSDTEKDVPKPAEKPVSTVCATKATKCVGCSAKLNVKSLPKLKNGVGEDNLCRHCAKLHNARQYCGVCKKVWQPNEKGNWVACDVCNIWIHAECDKISNKSLKALALEKVVYKCPECRKLQTPKKKNATGRVEASPYDVPDTVAVVCAEIEADYMPKLHQIACKCKQCGNSGKLMKPSEWERHTGCRKKKWKESIRMRNAEQTLLSWIQRLTQGGAIGLAYDGPEIRVPPKMRAQQLAASLELPYEPIRATFTTERCGVCRWVEDYDYNKMIVCNRCQIAVHEECYGVQYSDKAGPWVCRACETPEIERECCLCPVKGGAMKPSSVSGFWVHVTCAWFIREVTFKSAAKMEPAEGITNIDLSLFRQTCVVCRQVHGAVIQCCGSKCRKVYHTMCAFNAGYYMEINSYNDKNGVGVTRMITYCALHRAPDPEGRLHLSSPEGKIAEKRDVSHHRGTASVVSILSGSNMSRQLDAKFEKAKGEGSSSARCRPYDRQDWHKHHKRKGDAIAYRVTGFSWHSAESINLLRDYPEPGSTINERLASLPEMEKNRVCFGKSAIHGWGLFARRAIKEGEMVLEYRGERVRGSVADLREEHYRSLGKDCYLFKVNEDEVIDATDKGNLGRLINHSCEPSCYSKIFEETDARGDLRSRVVLMARKDVKAGEELTYDYRFDPEDKKVECFCGSLNCRQFMN